jgi:D-glycero-alpha-D-manno-heptose-7-phosphate kinase
MLIRGKAPLRVSFSGGGSDVSPYCDEYGGCVLSTTIGMYIYGALEVRADNEVHIFSLEYNELVKYDLGSEIAEGDKLSFLRAVIKRLAPPRGINLYLHSDAPPGTGLGSSGAISALIVGLINRAFNLALTRYDMAQLAYTVEHDDLGRAVGRQDHYAAVFGGMNFIEFNIAGGGPAETTVVPLRVEPWILEELGYHLQMFYTRKQRNSADIVANQVEFYKAKRSDTLEALAEMKDLTLEMKRCLLKGQMRRFGELLHACWENKKKMNPATANGYLDELYTAARNAGAMGGKILGAGGGGFFLFYTPFMKKGKVTEALEALGAQPVPVILDHAGMQVWEVVEQDLSSESEGLFGAHSG